MKNLIISRGKTLAFIVWLIVCSYYVIMMYVINNSSDYGAEVIRVEARLDRMIKENQRLEERLAKETSLTTVKRRAEKLGFFPIKDYVIIGSY